MRDPLHTADALIGSEIGHYRVEALIGQGAMGRIYRGLHPMIQREVAIKVLYQQDPASLARFFNEARIVNQIRHPNVVEIFDLGELPDGRCYLVMELLEGLPLSDYLEKRGARPEIEAAGLLLPVCDALEAAHREGVIHRDLKPENLFLARTKMGLRVKVLDFGIARMLTTEDASRYTQAGVLLGTPQYMAPEQAEQPRDTDGRADLYSLGVILYEMVTGKAPFLAESTIDMLLMHRDAPPPSPRAAVPALSPMLDQAVLRCLSKDPAARYQRAKELGEVLRSCCRDELPPLSLLDGLLPEKQKGEGIESLKTQENQLVTAETPAVQDESSEDYQATQIGPAPSDLRDEPTRAYVAPMVPAQETPEGVPSEAPRWRRIALAAAISTGIGLAGVGLLSLLLRQDPAPLSQPAPLTEPTVASATPNPPESKPSEERPATSPETSPASVPASVPSPPPEIVLAKPDTRLEKASALLKVNQKEEALGILEEMAQENVPEPEIYFLLVGLDRANKRPETCAYLRRFFELEPSGARAKKLKARLKSCR